MKVITCLFLLGISASSFAQHDKKEEFKKFLPFITRSLGGSFQQFNGLNGRVASLPQLKQLKDYTATIGLGFYKERNQFISQAGLTLGSSMSGHRDEMSSTIRYIALNADLGYDLVKNERITFYPFAGLGAQKYQAIFYRDNSGVDFDDVLLSPVTQSSISPVKVKNGFLVYRLGLGFSIKSPKYPASIGVQAGYTGSFKKHAWKSNEDQALNNAPEDRISQFYISLVLTSKPWMMMR
jgi:hypothetical protein